MHTMSRRAVARSLSTLPLALAVPFVPTSRRAATAQEATTLAVGEFVGAVALDDRTQHDILVAVIADPPTAGAAVRSAHAYLCNGEGLAEWFLGDIEGNVFSLVSKGGAAIEAELSDAGVRGTFALADGTTCDYAASRASSVAGLYRES